MPFIEAQAFWNDLTAAQRKNRRKGTHHSILNYEDGPKPSKPEAKSLKPLCVSVRAQHLRPRKLRKQMLTAAIL